MNKITKIIISLIACIIIIIVILIIFIMNRNEINTESEVSNEQSYDETKIQITESDFINVKYNSEYYSISSIIDRLCENVRLIYDQEYLIESYNGEITELSEEEIQIYRTNILNMLSTSYKEDVSLTESNMQNHLGNLASEDYEIDDMYVSDKENSISVYLVYGHLSENSNQYNFRIDVDLENNTLGVFLNDYMDKYEYFEENINNLDITTEKIEENDNNTYTSRDITSQEMAENYYNDYKNIFINNEEEAYNLLNEEYKEKRFSEYSNFDEFYGAKMTSIARASLIKYKVNNYDDYTQYICIDSNNNYFIFNVTAVMKYTIMLDNYTIELEEFTQIYEEATDTEKVFTNIDKFFTMINNKDYQGAYNVLDNTFRQNNFATVEEFRQYAQENFFENNVIGETVDVSESGQYYICTVQISDADTGNQQEETIIMQLNEGTDFVMSFTVEE